MAEQDLSCCFTPSGKCKRNIVARMDELRFCLHQAFKHALLLLIPVCVSWLFLFFALCPFNAIVQCESTSPSISAAAAADTQEPITTASASAASEPPRVNVWEARKKEQESRTSSASNFCCCSCLHTTFVADRVGNSVGFLNKIFGFLGFFRFSIWLNNVHKIATQEKHLLHHIHHVITLLPINNSKMN